MLFTDPGDIKIGTVWILFFTIWLFKKPWNLGPVGVLETYHAEYMWWKVFSRFKRWSERIQLVCRILVQVDLVFNLSDDVLLWLGLGQRDSVQALVEFATRNQLPAKLQEQMISHVQLKFKTESLQHEGTIATLPKAIRSSVAQCLFLDTLEQVYLFKGTSSNFRSQLVWRLPCLTLPSLG